MIDKYSPLLTTCLRLGLVQKAAMLVRLIADLLLHGHALPLHRVDLGLQLPAMRSEDVVRCQMAVEK